MKTRRIGHWLAAGAVALTIAAAGALSGCKEKAPAPGGTTPAPTTPAANAPAGGPAAAPAPATPAAEGAAGAAAAPKPATKSYTFGVIAKSQGNPVFQAARTGAFDAAKKLGDEFGVAIEINWRTPNNEDAQAQAQFVEQLASAGVDGIAISVSDAKVLTAAINAAVEKGIPVVTWDSDAPESKRFAYYGIDDVEAGREVARQLVKSMGDTGVVAILAGNQNATNLQARVRGVREELAKHPKITIKDTYYHAETAPEAVARVKQVQDANPDITGWAMVGGWPLFTEKGLDGVYDKAKVVSVDTLPQQLEYVRNGQVAALVGQDCYGWGFESVRLLLNKVHKDQAPANVINNFQLAVVTKENVEEYAGLWQKWLAGSK
jgi:ribose transport system substrate-binding protein